MKMDGRRGVVTGAASGLGRAIGTLFAEEGACVVLADRDADGAEAVAAEISGAGGSAAGRSCDVTVESDVVGAIDFCKERFGGFDFIVNNAGIQFERRLDETTNEQFALTFDVNVRGVFWGCKHAVAAMGESGGTIVNTASAVALAADPILPVYGASKHAVLGLTRAVGIGYADRGIRCNCICPGDTETPMIEGYWESTGDVEKAKAEMASMYPAGRIGQPIEVARAFLFLASEDSSYVNGSFMEVDGGCGAKVY